MKLLRQKINCSTTGNQWKFKLPLTAMVYNWCDINSVNIHVLSF